MVALETRPIESKITSSIGIRSNIVDGFGEVEGAALIPATTLIEATAHSDRIVNLTQQPRMSESKSDGKNWYGRGDFDFDTTGIIHCPYYHHTKSCCHNGRPRGRW